MKKEYLYERVYLHKSMIITENFHKNCLLIKSPLNSKFGIWFPKTFTGPSNYKDYFWVNIKKIGIYEMHIYKGFKICQTQTIRGITLIEEYESLKNANSKAFLSTINENSKDEHPIWNPKDKSEITEEKIETIDDKDEDEIIIWD